MEGSTQLNIPIDEVPQIRKKRRPIILYIGAFLLLAFTLIAIVYYGGRALRAL